MTAIGWLTVSILAMTAYGVIWVVLEAFRDQPRRVRRDVSGRRVGPVSPARMNRLHIIDDPAQETPR